MSGFQICKAERRHKFIMWTAISVLALIAVFNIICHLSQGRIEAAFNAYMEQHEAFRQLVQSTGLYLFLTEKGTDAQAANMVVDMGLGQLIMIGVGILLIYLAIAKGFEPLLLIPIGFGGILSNAPGAGIAEVMDGTTGFLLYIYNLGVAPPSIFPLLIFMGIGAMTDFGPMIANPKVAFLGGAAQFGIFFTLCGALAMSDWGLVNFSVKQAASIGIIGGADGPTAIFLTNKLAPHLLGAIAIAAYSYMALIPMIQPPIMKLMTSEADRKIKMVQSRPVSKTEKVLFPIIVTIFVILLLPSTAPLIGCLMLGNLFRECGCTDRLSDTVQNALMNIVTIFLSTSVGATMVASNFLKPETLKIIFLGLVAFGISTAGGLIGGNIMCKLSGKKVNPLIGSAGVSAVPMAARVSQMVGQKANPANFLLMHAMGPNVAGVIGSAIAAGFLLAVFG